MASLINTLSTGYSGLASAKAGIQTASHNVTNALTDGYSVQSVVISTQDAVNIGGLWVGQGVSTDDIQRAADSILGMRRIEQSGIASAADAEADALSLAEIWFDESQMDGISTKLNAFFDSLLSATSDPSDSALRLDVAYSGQALADSFNTTAQGLINLQADLSASAVATANEVNVLLSEVATLNDAIATAGGGSSAGDLADQRDNILRTLGEEFGMTATFESDGSATVYAGGHAVVSGGEARELDVSMDSTGALEVRVSVDAGFVDVTEDVSGTIGGLVAAISEINSYIEELNTIVQDFADAFNAVQNAGFDASGVAGVDVFSFDAATGAALTIEFSSAIIDDANLLAFAGAATADPGDSDNLMAMLDLESSPVVAGSQSVVDAVSALKSEVGFDIAQARSDAEAQSAVLKDLDDLYSSLYGVDIDQEAIDLITYQAAYEAAAKVISVVDEMLGTLMELI